MDTTSQRHIDISEDSVRELIRCLNAIQQGKYLAYYNGTSEKRIKTVSGLASLICSGTNVLIRDIEDPHTTFMKKESRQEGFRIVAENIFGMAMKPTDKFHKHKTEQTRLIAVMLEIVVSDAIHDYADGLVVIADDKS